MRPLIPAAYHPDTYLPFNIPGLGLIFAFVMLTLLGFLTANFVGRRMVGFGESILSRMPIVRPIYRTAKQIFETLFSSSQSSFRQVGLVEFPSPGMCSLVFLKQSPSASIAGRLPEGAHVSAWMPCTPTPATGFFYYVPRRVVIELDISVEQAMQPSSSPLWRLFSRASDDQTQKNLATLAAKARTAQTARAVAQNEAAETSAK